MTTDREPPRTADKLAALLPADSRAVAGAAHVVAADGTSYGAEELARATASCAGRLRAQGARAGDRALVLLDHDVHGIVLLAAASRLGLRVTMPYNLRAAALAEWRTIAQAAKPDFVIDGAVDADPQRALAVSGLAELGPTVLKAFPGGPDDAPDRIDTADAADPVSEFLTLFTSGSTGAPKAVSISEKLVCTRVASVTKALGFNADSRIFMSGLLNNTTGVIFSFGALMHGATLLLPASRDPERWPAQVAVQRATHIMLRPMSMQRFVEAAQRERIPLDCLQVVAYGAAALPRDLLERGRRLMPCSWVQGYGLSETYGPFCWLDETAHREGRYRTAGHCVGVPDETLDVRLDPLPGHPAGVGEVVVSGTAVMRGYVDLATGRLDPPDEWLRTGDAGSFNAAGDLVLHGRIDGSLLTPDGHRVYPEEIEAVLAGAPGVREAAVVSAACTRPAGQPEQLVACLHGTFDADPDAVRGLVLDALAGTLSPEKWPQTVYVSPRPLPRGANDKVLRARLIGEIDFTTLVGLKAA